ncbi:aromatic acid exporter family protein [Bacillus tianshenii]|uniref:aromatic acid exporter family protein n=1 Tax=Sutcliffiella tianshenii TaxID=1463404 RepID=UPI001CD2C76B|nr:aromatic acid exporter family protein [Bacillus tianshenii]MCA1318521.1 aromatic acid exporter family protein [Bacillus tianshenii]
MKHFVGGRIIKTGIAVFITALICEALNWPAMFAVIAAIVTIEPSAADSIKKAFVRFPASGIGALYAIVFYMSFGDNPLTYTLVALATIITCHKLRLDAGILVATLTGVAMITTVHDHYLSSFLVRLGTTFTGLTVSTLVNLLVLKPNYTPAISEKIKILLKETGELMETSGAELVKGKHDAKPKQARQTLHKIVRDVERIEDLCRYQREELKYHRFKRKDLRLFYYENKKLKILTQLTYHVGNLMFIPSHKRIADPEKGAIIHSTVRSMNEILKNEKHTVSEAHQRLIDRLFEEFSEKALSPSETDYHHLTTETVIFYELVAIHDLLEELEKTACIALKKEKALEIS